MAKGGRYLKQQPPKKKGGKVLTIILIVIALLLVTGVGAGIWYYNHVLNLVTRPGSVSMATMSAEEEAAMLGTVPKETVEATVNTEATEDTVPTEETWPTVVSDKKISNIMLVGQAAREDENYRLADTMILCSINRETKTLTMTSFLRDMRVNIPAYAGKGSGFNRMNVCYHLGSYYTGEVKGSMEMLSLAVKQNFGVQVDHTVEINFDLFMTFIDVLGGVDVVLTEAEARHMTYELNDLGEFEAGPVTLGPRQALAYARIRKIDNDFNRTNRQRTVIMSLLNKLKASSPSELNKLVTGFAPYITTDMTNEEITKYAFEFIPMLKDLNIVSQSVPFDGTYWYKNAGTEEKPDYVIDADLKKNGQLLRESIGLEELAD